MKFTRLFAQTAVLAALVVASSLTFAAPIVYSVNGLAAPATTITFDSGITLAKDDLVTNQYSASGVTLTPGLYFSPDDPDGSPGDPYPQAITGNYLGNYVSGQSQPGTTGSFTMNFSTVQTDVAFGLAANDTAFTITAFLNGEMVDSIVLLLIPSIDYSVDPINGTNEAFFYGFTGEQFNSITVSSEEGDLFVFDNLQLGTAAVNSDPIINPAAVPEPELASLFGLGLLAAVAARRRSSRRKGA